MALQMTRYFYLSYGIPNALVKALESDVMILSSEIDKLHMTIIQMLFDLKYAIYKL